MDGVMTLDKTRQQKQIICFYPGTIGGGGIARVFFNLIQTMLNDGIEVHLFLNDKSGNLYSQIPEGTKIFFGNGSVKNSLWPLLRYLRKYKPQALITAHAHVNIAAIVITKLALVPTKLVATIHTATSRDDKAGKPLRKKLNTISSRLIYPLADEIIAVSDAVADDLAKYLKMKRSRIKTIYNPVVTQKLLRLSQEKAEHPYFEQGKPVLISVGRLSEQKDFPNLINAFAVVKKEIDAKLIILGEGEDRAA
ncbi:MAG TPA: glycosyltransferase, partial [Trueperaceae bacterium]|nr:glycosyltransferase [Trueperaceae bacterium]